MKRFKMFAYAALVMGIVAVPATLSAEECHTYYPQDYAFNSSYRVERPRHDERIVVRREVRHDRYDRDGRR